MKKLPRYLYLVRVLQTNRISRMCVCVCVCVSDGVGWQAGDLGKSYNLSPKAVGWQNFLFLRGGQSLFYKSFNWLNKAHPRYRASLMAQTVKNLPSLQETWFNPRVRKIPLRREWLSTPVFLPGESYRQRSLVGYSPWDHKELDTTERLTLLLHYERLSAWLRVHQFKC